MNQSDFVDSYNLVLMLRDDKGKTYVEKHQNISLSDFEVIYGNITKEIIHLEMRLI